MDTIQIRDEFIKLVDSGVDAKLVIQDGLVRVNGEIEYQRGKKLHSGDVFSYDGQDVKVV